MINKKVMKKLNLFKKRKLLEKKNLIEFSISIKLSLSLKNYLRQLKELKNQKWKEEINLYGKNKLFNQNFISKN